MPQPRAIRTAASFASAMELATAPLTPARTADEKPAQAPAAHRQPNVIFILTDDQGSVDVNCYGAKDLETPNMDAITARGVRFTQFYAAAPICSPSRASILTGKVPQRAGLPNMASSRPGGLRNPHPGYD